MSTRYCGLPNPEYQILTSRAPFVRSVLARGESPAVTTAASFVSKIASTAGPVSLAAKASCWASAGLETATSKVAEIDSRHMPIGQLWVPNGHILIAHPEVGSKPLPSNE